MNNQPNLLYKLIFNKNSLNVPETDRASHENFLKHYENYKLVLNQITQTENQQKTLLRTIVNNTVNKKETLSSEILSNVTLSPDSNVLITEGAATTFMDRVAMLATKLKIDTQNKQMDFKIHVDNCSMENHQKFREYSLELAKQSLKENIQFHEAVRIFSSSINGSNVEIVAFLIQYSQYCEILTHLSVSPVLALGLGYKMFVYMYYPLHQQGAFTEFMLAVKSSVTIPKASLSFKFGSLVGPTTDMLYRHRATITISVISTLGTTIGLNYGLTAQIKEVGSAIMQHPYLPAEGTLIRSLFETIRNTTGAIGFSVGSIFGTLRGSVFHGLFGESVGESFKNFVEFFKTYLSESNKITKDILKKK